MFGFLAALGPIGIGAAIVGTIATAAYVYMKDDEKSESTKSKNQFQEEKNKIIKTEIESFKNKEKKRLKEKYNVNIEFDLNINYKIIMDSEISKKSKIISNLENEIQELDNLIFELKRMKNEPIC